MPSECQNPGARTIITDGCVIYISVHFVKFWQVWPFCNIMAMYTVTANVAVDDITWA